MTEFGKTVIITGEVKYVGEGDDPADNIYMKAYARVLKGVYQPERSKREDHHPKGWIRKDDGCGALSSIEI